MLVPDRHLPRARKISQPGTKNKLVEFDCTSLATPSEIARKSAPTKDGDDEDLQGVSGARPITIRGMRMSFVNLWSLLIWRIAQRHSLRAAQSAARCAESTTGRRRALVVAITAFASLSAPPVALAQQIIGSTWWDGYFSLGSAREPTQQAAIDDLLAI
jgi:hypothetical protein